MSLLFSDMFMTSSSFT